MSREARLRQLRFLNSIDRRKIKGVIFSTMTVRGTSVGVLESWCLIEAARRKWFHRLRRFLASAGCPGWFAMWRKEPHLSGVAHLHVLVFFTGKVPHLVKEFRPWNDRAWAECVGDLTIQRTACSSELMRSWNGVASYLCKYLAKDQELADVETGKVWDVVGREHVPVSLESEDVKKAVGQRFRRACRKWQQRKSTFFQVYREHDGEWKWIRVRPWRYQDREVCVADQVAQARAAGLRVRLHRPRLAWTTDVTVYVESVIQQFGRRDVRQVEVAGVEKHTFYSSGYFVPADEARRLLELCKRNYVDDCLLEESLPI
jgi:hypothetical protein